MLCIIGNILLLPGDFLGAGRRFLAGREGFALEIGQGIALLIHLHRGVALAVCRVDDYLPVALFGRARLVVEGNADALDIRVLVIVLFPHQAFPQRGRFVPAHVLLPRNGVDHIHIFIAIVQRQLGAGCHVFQAGVHRFIIGKAHDFRHFILIFQVSFIVAGHGVPKHIPFRLSFVHNRLAVRVRLQAVQGDKAQLPFHQHMVVALHGAKQGNRGALWIVPQHRIRQAVVPHQLFIPHQRARGQLGGGLGAILRILQADLGHPAGNLHALPHVDVDPPPHLSGVGQALGVAAPGFFYFHHLYLDAVIVHGGGDLIIVGYFAQPRRGGDGAMDIRFPGEALLGGGAGGSFRQGKAGKQQHQPHHQDGQQAALAPRALHDGGNAVFHIVFPSRKPGGQGGALPGFFQAVENGIAVLGALRQALPAHHQGVAANLANIVCPAGRQPDKGVKPVQGQGQRRQVLHQDVLAFVMNQFVVIDKQQLLPAVEAAGQQ